MEKETQYIIYLRVSTAKQGASGLGMDGQLSACKTFAGGAPILQVYKDVQTGKDDDRPALAAAIQHCQESGAVLLVAKLDRLARRASYLLDFVERYGITFKAVDKPELGTVELGIHATLAQWEREQISERTKAALAEKKAQGVKLGNPRLDEFRDKATAASAEKRAALAKARYAENRAINCICLQRQQGVSYAKIADYLNSEGFKTNRGKQWSATQVMRAFKLCCE